MVGCGIRFSFMKVSIIIPVFNEENTIIKILEEINNQVLEDFSLEIIVVDDCSQDSTVDLLKENSSLYTKLIILDTNLGKGGAVKQGVLKSTGEYILFQDADLEYSPRDYKKIFDVIKRFNAEVIIGSRFLSPEYTRVHYFYNRIGNRLITLLFNLLHNSTFTDIYSCYLCYKKNLFDPEDLKINGWGQQAEILSNAVKRSSIHFEVPISYNGRSYEEGKKIKARHFVSVIYTIIKKRIF